MSPQLLPLPHSEWVGAGAGAQLTRAQEANLSRTSTQLPTQLPYYPSHSAPRSASISSMAPPTEEQLMLQSVLEYEVAEKNPLRPGENRSDSYLQTLSEQYRRLPIMQTENFHRFLKLYKANQVTTPTNALGCDSLLIKCRWWSLPLIQALMTRHSSRSESCTSNSTKA